eukprot:4880956-Pyramimonas_sp.AAC.1
MKQGYVACEAPEKGPRVRVSSSPPLCTHAMARPKRTQIVPKMATLTLFVVGYGRARWVATGCLV